MVYLEDVHPNLTNLGCVSTLRRIIVEVGIQIYEENGCMYIVFDNSDDKPDCGIVHPHGPTASCPQRWIHVVQRVTGSNACLAFHF